MNKKIKEPMEKWEIAFNKKFVRVNKQTGKKEEGWFVRETTAKELKDWVRSQIKAAREEEGEKIKEWAKLDNYCDFEDKEYIMVDDLISFLSQDKKI